MDHSIRRRVANDDLTFDEAEDLEWELAEKSGDDQSHVGVVVTGFRIASDPGLVSITPGSQAKFEPLHVDTISALKKSLNSLQTSLGTFQAKPLLDALPPFEPGEWLI